MILASLSGQSSNGSFSYMPLSDGIVDITMFINMVLFSLNFFICLRLIKDEWPPSKLNPEERALFRFFHARCGLTPLQFQTILDNGEFFELPPDTEVPRCGSTLYLVLEGKVACQARQGSNPVDHAPTFYKRSGQFFDIKLFNLFSLPVGFDNDEFKAKTLTATKFFRWNVYGLIAMRDSQSPSLRDYWEYIVLHTITGIAIQSYLHQDDTLYDSLLIPEHESWLEGAPSRDFWKIEKPVGDWAHLKRQFGVIRSSMFHIIPPKGVRQRPGMPGGTNPKQAYFELVCKTLHAQAEGKQKTPFHFLSQREGDHNREGGTGTIQEGVEEPPKGLFQFLHRAKHTNDSIEKAEESQV